MFYRSLGVNDKFEWTELFFFQLIYSRVTLNTTNKILPLEIHSTWKNDEQQSNNFFFLFPLHIFNRMWLVWLLPFSVIFVKFKAITLMLIAPNVHMCVIDNLHVKNAYCARACRKNKNKRWKLEKRDCTWAYDMYLITHETKLLSVFFKQKIKSFTKLSVNGTTKR